MNKAATRPLTLYVEGLTPGRTVVFRWDQIDAALEYGPFEISQNGKAVTSLFDPRYPLVAGFPHPVSTQDDFIGYEATSSNIRLSDPSSGLITVEFTDNTETEGILTARFRY